MSDDLVQLPPGFHGPVAAEYDDGDECVYCGRESEFKVELTDGGVTFHTCAGCSRTHRVHAQDLVDDQEVGDE